ncbi:hypothetical protein LCGC14_2306280 [marine sediment metagenome]|uniref:Uncharacterized protein n=1 Tax=marine sediment metagenome TaxID=412755 RepID=A0A0F9CMI0_9ZZZZ
MPEAVARGRWKDTPEGVDDKEAYWDLCFEALDSRWADGSTVLRPTAGLLYNKDGKRKDNTQRPYRLAVAFAGLQISLFPGDPEGKFDAFCAGIGVDAIGTNPSFDASKVVGRVFLVEMEPMEIGRDMPLPITAEPEGYIYTGKVREVKPREGGDDQAGAAPASNNLVDITKPGGEEALKQILGILDGQAADADLFDLLRTGGLDNRTLIDGESVLGVAVNDGALTTKLTEAGHVVIKGGKILRTADQNESPVSTS